jgi:retron-type reverse transcriptase
MLEGWDVRSIDNINWIVKLADEDNWLNPIQKVSNRKGLSNIIASLCCTEMEVERKNDKTGEWEKSKRNVLPQGAPTSPVITNIVCQKLDFLLSGVAKRFGLKYSRYADDITFSSMHNVYQPESKFLKELNRIIAEQKFQIKESKTRLQKDGFRKEVTGLLVNEKANVQQRYIKQLRMWLYYWERYGYERAYTYFLAQYVSEKGHVKKGKPDMSSVIAGKLDFLKMVKSSENLLFTKLVNRYEALTDKEQNHKFNRLNHLNSVLIKVFDNGIDEAMKLYKK